MRLTASEVIEQHGLKAHPEGGYYRESYISTVKFYTSLGEEKTNRPLSSAIIYLLQGNERSRIHQIDGDEMWHFYMGSPIEIIELRRGEGPKITRLGDNEESRSVFQHLIPAGTWFGARILSPDDYALVGCTVTPAFDFRTFKLAEPDRLREEYPESIQFIELFR